MSRFDQADKLRAATDVAKNTFRIRVRKKVMKKVVVRKNANRIDQK